MSVTGERFIDLPHGRGRLAVRTWHADVPGTPVLAVHGWMDNAASFDRLAPLLPGAPIHALDLAGHGLSDPRPAGMRYHNADFLDDLLAALDALCPGRTADFLGHSLGAGLLMLLAGIFPERVRRLVMIDGMGPLSAEPEQYATMTRASLENFRDWRPDRRPIPDEAAAVQARMNGVTGPLSEAASRILCTRSLARREDGTLFWRTDKRLRQNSLMRYSEAQVISCIRGITAPTLLIRGEQGAPFPALGYGERVRHFRDLRTVSLPGGHHLHLDDSPEAVAAAVRDFL